jgi:hypothetical protein
MVPILSRRSIVILIIGLIVGILIAFAYWIVSPAISSIDPETGGTDSTDTGLLGMLGIEPNGPFWSRVSVQIVNPGSDYIPLYSLQQIGEYYAAKHSSLPFFQFLSDELERLPIDYSYTVDELDEMIGTEYDYNSELPSIRVTITGDTKEEVATLAQLVPQAFIDFLKQEEKDKREQEYEDTLEEIETVKSALYDAQQELDNFQSDEIFNNPTYIALSARVDALQQELDNQISDMSLQYLDGTELQDEYNKTLNEMADVAAELADAQEELLSISEQNPPANTEDMTHMLILESQIRGLQSQLDSLITGTTETTGLTQLIAAGITSGIEYENIMLQIETTAEALAEAQMEYDELVSDTSQSSLSTNLDYQIAQIKVDTLTSELQALQDKLIPLYTQIINLNEGNGQSDNQIAFDRISVALAEAKKELETLEYQLGYDPLEAGTNLELAQEKVNTLNSRLTELTDQLGTLVGEDNESLETGYLVVGNPSVPSPVLPERSRARNTLLTGAIAGVIVAWVIMNFRWLINLISPSNPAKPEDEEE